MQNFNSYPFFKMTCRSLLAWKSIFIFFISVAPSFLWGQKSIIHGLDKQSDTFEVITGDKYFDSGGPGGSKLPDQPGNYINCSDPFNESDNCTSVFTLCSNSDTVAVNFVAYQIVTGDRLKIFAGSSPSNPVLFNSQTQGVSLNGMKLTTGTFIKSTAVDGCLTFEWFCTTIGNSIGWEVDIIVQARDNPEDTSCIPQCKPNILISIPLDTCYKEITLDEVLEPNNIHCDFELTLYYPFGTDRLDRDAVNGSHINSSFLFEVKSQGSSCFGYLEVVESSSPFPLCTSDTIHCFEWDENVSPGIEVTTCSGLKFSYKTIRFESLPCDDQFMGLIIREIEIKSEGNTICIDTLFLWKPSFDSLQCPSDLKLSCEQLPAGLSPVQLSPDFLQNLLDKNKDNRLDSDPDNFLNPFWQGFSLSDSSAFCGLGVSYSDFIIPGCGNTYKIRRQWILNAKCLAGDTVCIQNILVEDQSPPVVPAISSMEFQVNPSDCKAQVVLDTFMNIDDCNTVIQRLELVYKDPLDPGKQIVINNFLPVKLSLSPGGYNAKFLFSDPCFNASRLEICIQVLSNESPVASAVVNKQYFLNPGECWSRVYANDLDSLSSDVCCPQLHFAIAIKDSVEYYRQYWVDFITNQCGGPDQYNNHKNEYDELIDRWITSFLFKDYLDLTACNNHGLLLRVFKSCNLPPMDPGFSCGPHQWFSYLSIPEFRGWNNSLPDSTKCLSAYPLDCLAALSTGLFSLDDSFQYPEAQKLEDTGSCASAYVAQYLSLISRNYDEVEVQIEVVDTLPLIIPSLPDLDIYSDGFRSDETMINYCCADSTCQTVTWPAKPWPVVMTCNCDEYHFIHFYGGPLRSDAVFDQTGNYSYPFCKGYDELSGPAPVYCQHILLQDTLDGTKVEPDSIFYTPVFNQVPGPRQFNIQSPCSFSYTFTFKDSTMLDSCGIGSLFREWTFTNECGKVVQTSQKLIFKPHSDFEVIFPPDVELDCSMSENVDSLIVALPLIKDAETENMDIRYRDSLLEDSTSACMILVRKWQVFNSCVYNPLQTVFPDYILNDSMVADPAKRYCVYRALKDNGDGYMQYTQYIRFIDKEPPQISISDTMVLTSNSCQTSDFLIHPGIKDDCSPSGKIELDAFLEGATNTQLAINDGVLIPAGLTIGEYILVLTGRDLCGNTDTTKAVISVGDGSTPVAFCVSSQISLSLPESGQMNIYARDFDTGSRAGCATGSLRFSFSPDPTDSILTLNCDSSGLRSYSIWMTSQNNKQATCQVEIMVSGQAGDCGPTEEIQIAGSVTTGQQLGIHQVNLSFEPTLNVAMTDINGLYQSPSLPSGENYIIRPSKQDAPLNGVSSLDLLVMEKHILGQELLTDSYLRIAADINKSGTITVSDLIELRRLILGSITMFSKNENWNFVPADYIFPDPENPWIYPRTIELMNLSSSVSNANFIGIKTGDVNYTAVLSLNGLESRAKNLVEFQVKTHPIAGGQRLEIYSKTILPSVQAMQLGFRLDHPAAAIQYAGGQIKLQAEEFSFHSGREFKLCWVSPAGKDMNTLEPLISLDLVGVTGKKQTQLLDQKSFASFIYFQGNEYGIKWLEKSDENTSTRIFPNPGKEEVNIEFFIDDLGANSLCIQTTNGRNIYIKNLSLKRGWNHILLNKSDLGGPGLYYFVKYFGHSLEKSPFMIF